MRKRERKRRELYLSSYIDDYGRNAVDQGIVSGIDDPDFWRLVGEYKPAEEDE